ncbi:MAG: rhodanese-like domain-containing protein [Eubacteriales bacterium]
MFKLFSKNIKNLKPEDFKKEMSGDYLLVDVRTAQEFVQGHIKGAVNIPLDRIPSNVGKLKTSEEKKLLLYCLSGARSMSAATFLDKKGVGNLHNLMGGISAWERAHR